MANLKADRVLVTGISGFIASHIAKRLLADGYLVRGTVRNKAKGQRIVDALAADGADVSRLELVEADLGADAGWAEAVKDCRYIQHIASPLPVEQPRDREALVPQARAGAQRVLEHGYSAGAERIVMTSSFSTMIGRPDRGKAICVTENDWTDPEWKALSAYPVSKTRAELSAWAYVEAQGFKPKLVTICPGLVFGPDTYHNGGASLEFFKLLFGGDLPMTPKLALPIVDVRDCAAIHVAAMTAKEAGGRRLLATSDTLWIREVSEILRAEYPRARKLPKSDMPNFIMKIAAMFDERLKAITFDLGIYHTADAAYVTNITGVVPRPAKESVIASAQTMAINGDIEVS